MWIGIGNSIFRIGGSGQSWDALAPSGLTTSITSDAIIAAIVTNNSASVDGYSWEYSTDGVTYTEHGTSAIASYNYDSLTEGTVYYFRCRVYKGAEYSGYCSVVVSATEATAIRAGNTVCWISADAASTITKDGSNVVSRVNDKLGSGHDFTVGTCVWDATNGFTFNGLTHYMKTATFTYAQPEWIYMVIKCPVALTASYIIDGYDATHRMVYGMSGTYGAISWFAYAGTGVTSYIPHDWGKWRIIRMQFNGAASYLKQMDISSAAKNWGAQAGNGITIGGANNGTALTNVYIKEAIFRNTADSEANEQKIYDYLYGKYYSLLVDTTPTIRAGMVLTLDDYGNLSGWLLAHARFKNTYNWKATFSLDVPNGTIAQAIAADVALLQADGHKMANHTNAGSTDGDAYIAANGEQAYYDNLIAPCQVNLENYLNVPDKLFHYSYSSGFYADLHTILFNAGFTQARASNQDLPGAITYYDGTNQAYKSNAIEVLSGTYANMGTVIAALEYARDNDKIIPLHDHGTEPTAGLNYERLEYILQFITRNHMTFYTTNELLPSLFT